MADTGKLTGEREQAAEEPQAEKADRAVEERIGIREDHARGALAGENYETGGENNETGGPRDQPTADREQ
jgi:hypothetical protein